MNPIASFFLQADLRLVVAFAVVAILGSARLTRVIVHDSYPPAAWLRNRWDDIVHAGEVVQAEVIRDGEVVLQQRIHPLSSWSVLFHCWWCMSPWVTAGCLGWFALSFVAPWIAVTWWVFWTWLAFAYVASIIISRDEPAETE